LFLFKSKDIKVDISNHVRSNIMKILGNNNIYLERNDFNNDSTDYPILYWSPINQADSPISLENGTTEWDSVSFWFENEVCEFLGCSFHRKWLKFNLEDFELMHKSPIWMYYYILSFVWEIYLSKEPESVPIDFDDILLDIPEINPLTRQDSIPENREIDEENARERLNVIVDSLSSIPFMLEKFTARIIYTSNPPEEGTHIFYFLFWLDYPQMKKIFDYFIEKNFVNDKFLQQILHHGFIMQKPQNLLDMLSVVLFDESPSQSHSNSYLFVNINKISLNKLGSCFAKAAPIIVEEFMICFNNNNGFGKMCADDCFAILVVAFRIESIIMKNSRTDSRLNNVSYVQTEIEGVSKNKFTFLDVLCDDKKTLQPFSYYLSNVFKNFLTQSDDIINNPAYRFTAYSRDAIEDVICGVFSISVEFKSNLFTQFLEIYGSEIFETDGYLCDGSYCKKKILRYIPSKFTMSKDMQKDLNIIIKDARHYSYEVLELLTLTYTETENRDLIQHLISTSLCLYDFTNIKEKVVKLLKNILHKYDTKRNLIDLMCKRVIDSDKSDLVETNDIDEKKYFQIESIYICTELALTALNVLNYKEYIQEKGKLMALMETYIINNPPLNWINLFRGAFSTAIFLKYATREDLTTAYDKIKQRNAIPGIPFDTTALGKRLKNTKAIFFCPIISKVDIDSIMKDNSPNAGAYHRILDKIKHSKDQQIYREGSMIYELTIAWIEHFNHNNSVKIPVPPRNIQIINVLNIWKWIKGTIDHDTSKRISDTLNGRCMISQVSTGEGKRYYYILIL
jgi:hypothetical protein